MKYLITRLAGLNLYTYVTDQQQRTVTIDTEPRVTRSPTRFGKKVTKLHPWHAGGLPDRLRRPRHGQFRPPTQYQGALEYYSETSYLLFWDHDAMSTAHLDTPRRADRRV